MPPRNCNEETLARIWAEVLRVERVGIHDNFFELGGDSILSIQIVSRARQAGLSLMPGHLFDYQRIVDLATVANDASAIVAEQGQVQGKAPLTPIQSWFFEQALPNPHHWNMAVLLEVRQVLDPTNLKIAVQKLVNHHDALRMRFSFQDGEWWQTNLAYWRIYFYFVRLERCLAGALGV